MAKSHPVQEYDAALKARAVHFTAFQFRGRGERRKTENLPSLESARAEAAVILSENAGRPVAIYAVDAAGMQAHIENITA